MKTMLLCVILLVSSTVCAAPPVRTYQPFGNGVRITVRQKGMAPIYGQSRRFGTGSITRWSNGQRTTYRPFGNRIISRGPNY